MWIAAMLAAGLIATAAPVNAQLGETKKQLMEQFGIAVEIDAKGTNATFEQGNWRVKATLVDGRTASVGYLSRRPIPQEAIVALLDRNGGGSEWEESGGTGFKNPLIKGKWWKRKDGAAAFQLGEPVTGILIVGPALAAKELEGATVATGAPAADAVPPAADPNLSPAAETPAVPNAATATAETPPAPGLPPLPAAPAPLAEALKPRIPLPVVVGVPGLLLIAIGIFLARRSGGGAESVPQPPIAAGPAPLAAVPPPLPGEDAVLCPQCQSPMVAKVGLDGVFLRCSTFPMCAGRREASGTDAAHAPHEADAA